MVAFGFEHAATQGIVSALTRSLPSASAEVLARAAGDTLGATVAELDQLQRADLGVGSRGVPVEEVQDGPAVRARLRPGDVILALSHRHVHNAAELASAARKLPGGRPVPALVQRRGEATPFLALRAGARGCADRRRGGLGRSAGLA